MIDQSTIDAVRAKVDIVRTVQTYLPLRKMGTRWVARCPFHSEKTASFSVSPSRGIFHCFGCKASGDSIEFVMRMDGSNFPEAIESLAESLGIQVSHEEQDPSAAARALHIKEQIERLRHANQCACEFFEQSLQNDEHARIARDVIAARGISDEVSKEFRLGYAPAEWSALSEYLVTRGVSPSDAEIVGLTINNGRQKFDRFRHRIMFPVFDRLGHIIAFSGRILEPFWTIKDGIVPNNPGKYINSPETPIYKKSESLFGLQVASRAMARSATAIIVEGNFDVVAMHQHGFSNTVCPLGTAFTKEQASLLRRFAESATILFDADDAGRNATRASHAALESANVSATVATLSGSKDPDEMLRTEGGRERLATAISTARGMPEWLLLDLSASVDSTAASRAKAVADAATIISAIKSPIERAEIIELASRQLVVDVRSIEKALSALKATKVASVPAEDTSDVVASHVVEFMLMECIIAVPELAKERTIVDAVEMCTSKHVRDLFSILDGTPDELSIFLQEAGPAVGAWFGSTVIALEGEPQDIQARKSKAMRCATRILASASIGRVYDLRASAARAEAAGDRKSAVRFYRESMQLAAQIRKVKRD